MRRVLALGVLALLAAILAAPSEPEPRPVPPLKFAFGEAEVGEGRVSFVVNFLWPMAPPPSYAVAVGERLADGTVRVVVPLYHVAGEPASDEWSLRRGDRWLGLDDEIHAGDRLVVAGSFETEGRGVVVLDATREPRVTIFFRGFDERDPEPCRVTCD